MKILIMCEGSNELEIVNILLDNDLLIFGRDDLLDLRAFHARQLDSPPLSVVLGMYHGSLEIYRIGDTLKDVLKRKDLSKYNIRNVRKVCTKPELEMLLIISENKWSDYDKRKSLIMPKEYAKRNISFRGRRYDNSTHFYHDYYSGDPTKLVNAIREYKHLHKAHRAGEEYLADILK